MANTLGFGLLGAGLIAPFHANALRNCSGGHLVAVCDTDRARADALAAQFGVRAHYGLDALLADPEVGAVNVLTPNHLHHDAVLRCAAAGKHVLVEKPPAMSLAETDAMIAACRAAGVKFGCTVQCRMRPAVAAMKSALDEGRFGAVLHADTYMKWWRTTEYYHSDAWRSSRQSGAGVTVQHAFHYIDLLQYLAGPAARVEARMTNLLHPSVKLEDTVSAFVEYASGARGVVQASTAMWPGYDMRVEINGSEGAAIMTGERIAYWKFRDERPGDDAIRQIGSAEQATGASGPTDLGYADHQSVIQDMIDAVAQDREPAIPVESVRPALEIALAMYQSAARGCAVALPVQDDPGIWEFKP